MLEVVLVRRFWLGCFYVRHENGCQHLEEQTDHVEDAGQVGADSGAEGREAGEEGADGEEEADQDKGEHEAGQVEEFARSEELLGDAFFGVECSGASWI